MSILSLSTVKGFLRITHTKEDVVLQIMLDAAEDFIARYASVRLNSAAADADVEEFLDGGGVNLWPTQHPINSVASVSDRETSTEVTTIRNDEWKIWERDERRWDSGQKRWDVHYNAGYTGEANMPAGIKLAVFNLMFKAYQQRGGIKQDKGLGVAANWESLFDSDIVALLRPFMFRSTIG